MTNGQPYAIVAGGVSMAGSRLRNSFIAIAIALSLMPIRSLAQWCPLYAVELRRAQVFLSGGNRQDAIRSLRDAQRELAECMKREPTKLAER